MKFTFPSVLSRLNPKVHKNDFGHLLVLAGSRHMLGAAALTSLSAMRAGAGMVTAGIPKDLNIPLQKKMNSVVMTHSLPQTSEQSFCHRGVPQILKSLQKYSALVLGPGISTNASTKKFVLALVEKSSVPIVLDADGLNNIVGSLQSLQKTKSPKVLTPHPGELARLMNVKKEIIEKNRRQIALEFAKTHECVLVLKGHHTVVADADGHIFVNKTGNAGMATAGSGDVLSGIIGAFLAQGMNAFEAAKFGVYIHGLAGDLAAKDKTKVSLIATDIVEYLPKVFKKLALNK